MYQQSSLQVINIFSSKWLFETLFAVAPQFDGLINNLIMTTDRLIMGSRTISTSARSSSQGAKSRIAPASLVWSVALRSSRDIKIQASIEYVVCLPPFILFIDLILRIGRSREYMDLMHKPHLTNYFPSGYWCNLWSSLHFANQLLGSCVDIIHVDIVEIWNLCDKSKVSSPPLPCCFNCLTESVSIKRPIQNKFVPHRQRTGCAGWRRIVEVSVSRNK